MAPDTEAEGRAFCQSLVPALKSVLLTHTTERMKCGRRMMYKKEGTYLPPHPPRSSAATKIPFLPRFWLWTCSQLTKPYKLEKSRQKRWWPVTCLLDVSSGSFSSFLCGSAALSGCGPELLCTFAFINKHKPKKLFQAFFSPQKHCFKHIPQNTTRKV